MTIAFIQKYNFFNKMEIVVVRQFGDVGYY